MTERESFFLLLKQDLNCISPIHISCPRDHCIFNLWDGDVGVCPVSRGYDKIVQEMIEDYITKNDLVEEVFKNCT